MDFQGRSIRNSHKRGQLFDEGQHLMKSRFYPEFHSKSIMYPVQHSNTSYISRNKPDLWTTTPTSPKSFASTCTINPTALKSRSVSFTDHTSTGLPSLYKHPHLRSRMLSLPNIEDDVDLDAVEDAFVSPSLPSTSAAFQYGIYPQVNILSLLLLMYKNIYFIEKNIDVYVRVQSWLYSNKYRFPFIIIQYNVILFY